MSYRRGVFCFVKTGWTVKIFPLPPRRVLHLSSSLQLEEEEEKKRKPVPQTLQLN